MGKSYTNWVVLINVIFPIEELGVHQRHKIGTHLNLIAHCVGNNANLLKHTLWSVNYN